MLAENIDEVLSQLTQIIKDAETNRDRAGYFAALYFKVTSRVRDGIAKSEFENGARMEKLDVLFANRYLSAVDQWKNNKPLSGSWLVALNGTRRSSLLILQHLLLGMNAHINLDLGIAAVETMEGQPIADIKKDFDAINGIISALAFEIIQELNRLSPLLSLMGLHAQRTNSILIQFSITNARDGAWCFAEDLSKSSEAEKETTIQKRDEQITQLAYALIKIKGIVRLTIWIIHLFEWRDPAKIIGVLNNFKKAFIKTADLT